MFGDGSFRRRRAPRDGPIARRFRIGHRLERREGLGGDDEQRPRRIEVAGRSTKSVASTLETKRKVRSRRL